MLIVALRAWIKGEVTQEYVCNIAKEIGLQKKVKVYKELEFPARLLIAVSMEAKVDDFDLGEKENAAYIFHKVFMHLVRNDPLTRKYEQVKS